METMRDLIKEGKISENKSYRQEFITKSGKRGFFEIKLYHNRLWFYAKIFGDALPFKNHRITRKTTMNELLEEINWY